MFSNQYAVRINELDVNPPGTDNPYEYVEIDGPAGMSLNNFYFASVEGDDVNPATRSRQPKHRPDWPRDVCGESCRAIRSGRTECLIIKSPTGGFTPAAGTTVVPDSAFDNAGGILQNGTNSFFLLYSPTTPITAFVTDPIHGSNHYRRHGFRHEWWRHQP